MFQLNSWIPLLSASSRLAVRNTRRNPTTLSGTALESMCSRLRRGKITTTPKPWSIKDWSASDIQPLEPKLLPKLRFCFADFPWSHCSIDQRLFTSESGCGYRYGPPVRDGILGRSSLRIAEAPNGAKSAPLSLCVQTPSSN